MGAGHTREALTFASAASYSTGISIRGADVVIIELPEMTTEFAANTVAFEPQVAKTNTASAFITLRTPVDSITGVSYNTVSITSNSGAWNVIVPELAGANFVRLTATTVATDGYTAYVHTFQK